MLSFRVEPAFLEDFELSLCPNNAFTRLLHSIASLKLIFSYECREQDFVHQTHVGGISLCQKGKDVDQTLAGREFQQI